MMNKISCMLVMAMLCITFGYAQNNDVRYTLLSNNAQEAVIRVDFPTHTTQSVDVNGQLMQKLQMSGAYPLQETGSPELLTTATSIIIPAGCQPTTEVITSQYDEISGFELAPSKGRLTRNIDPATIAYVKGASYFTDRYQYDDTVILGETYQLRDFHGIPVRFFPFSYNPVQKKLKVYHSITVKIHFNATRSISAPTHVVSTFHNIYNQHFLNYNQLRSNPVVEQGDILILCPAEYCAAMQPFIDWKIKNGYHVEIVSMDNVGNTGSDVRTYIANYYNNHNNLAFVILVGDGGKFPIINVSGNVSDNFYAEIVGNDVYPDIIIGKISAETEEQVSIQVSKFIQYEQNPQETGHFSSFLGIASNQGPGDNSEYDYQHIRNIDNKLLNYTYTDGYELFEGNQGGLDAAGNPTVSQVANALNAGVGIINYTGHGAETFWVTTDFSIGNINGLTNYNKLPFIISVACVNGAYYGRTCFAEGWLRANKNGKLTGAVGALMSTINQPWNSPMCAQDHMINMLTGYNNTEKKQTFGGLAFNGIIKMLDTYNDYEVARTWILFGDPTLQMRTATPEPLMVTHEEQIILGATNLDMTCAVEGAKITLTHQNEILGSGFVSNGILSLPISPDLSAYDSIHILASACNYIPYEADVVIMPSEGPYISCGNFIVHDNGNNDGQADYRETVSLDLPMTNVGNTVTNNIDVVLYCNDPYVTIVDSVANYAGSIQPEETGTLANAFTVIIADSVPAAHAVNFGIRLQYSDENRNAHRILTLHAPELAIGNLDVNDQLSGNGNGKLDFNESVTLNIDLQNIGNGAATAGTATLSCLDGRLILYRFPQDVDAIQANSSHIISFKAKTSNLISLSSQTTLRLTYIADGYRTVKEFKLKIGEDVEDWENGDFTHHNWTNTSSSPWFITTQNPYEGNYAVRSGSIGDSQSSILSIVQQCAGQDSISFYYKVSSEDGYDYLKFFIDGIVKGSWCGEEDWTYAAFPVTEGQHTFRWSYIKDSYMSAGSDMAMIDKITFPAASAPVSIEDHLSFDEITLMPNPTTGNLQIRIPDDLQGQDLHFQLFDLMGNMLQQGNMEGNSTALSLSGYANGLYIVRIYADNNVIGNYKVIKQ